jgi:hypothetical protein
VPHSNVSIATSVQLDDLFPDGHWKYEVFNHHPFAPKSSISCSFFSKRQLTLSNHTCLPVVPAEIMLNNRSMLVALACAMFSSAQATNTTCDPASLNTTSFNYVNDIENQTVYEMAVKFNRGVCDIGRANLSLSHFFPFTYK